MFVCERCRGQASPPMPPAASSALLLSFVFGALEGARRGGAQRRGHVRRGHGGAGARGKLRPGFIRLRALQGRAGGKALFPPSPLSVRLARKTPALAACALAPGSPTPGPTLSAVRSQGQRGSQHKAQANGTIRPVRWGLRAQALSRSGPARCSFTACPRTMGVAEFPRCQKVCGPGSPCSGLLFS